MKTEMSRFEVTRAEDGDGPIDVELITNSTEAALAMRMGTSTRKDIDARTPVLIGHLQLLLAEELGAEEDEMARQQCRKAYKVLDLNNRLTENAPTFTAYFFMCEVADLTRRLLWIYTQRSGAGAA